MGRMMHAHSVAASVDSGPCETIVGLPHPRLRPFVAGYAGFAARPLGTALRRRALPLNQAIVVIDFIGPERHVTGPRSAGEVYEQVGRRRGIAVELTPAGVSALLGVPTRELVGATVALDEVLGRRGVRLVEQLDAAPSWAARFGVLDERLSAWLDPDRIPAGPVLQAWSRLQDSAGRVRIGGLADGLGISRRYLEIGFQRQIGLTPKTVARIARFQRAVQLLGRPVAQLETALACGYADQQHFSREIRAMTGITATELFAFLQDSGRLSD